MKDFLKDNAQKIMGGLVAMLGMLQSMVPAGAFEGLMEPSSVRWLGILTGLLGIAISGTGFTNTTKERMAAAFTSAIKAQPGEVTPEQLMREDMRPHKQAGLARPVVLAALCALSFIGVATLAACAGTMQAYKQAQDHPADLALIVLEHYDALLVQAIELKANPAIPREVIARIQAADLKAQPLIDTLRPLQRAYSATAAAKDELALRQALHDAASAVAQLIKAVDTAKAGA